MNKEQINTFTNIGVEITRDKNLANVIYVTDIKGFERVVKRNHSQTTISVLDIIESEKFCAFQTDNETMGVLWSPNIGCKEQ